MPTDFIGTGSPTTLTMDGACTVDGSNIGLLAFVSVVPLSSGTSFTTFTSRTLTYGSSNIAATSLGAVDSPSVNGWIEIFFLQGIEYGAGSASKVVATLNTAVESIGIETITYTNVSQVTPGSFTVNSFTGTSCSLPVASSPGKYIVGGFACSAAITGANSGTQRLVANSGTSGDAQNASVVDIAGAAVSTLTATTASSANWAAAACSIDFIAAANADHQSLQDDLHYSLIGSAGPPSTSTSSTDVATAAAAQVANIAAHSAALSALLHPSPSPSLVTASVDFSTYSDSSTLPSMFTTGNFAGSGSNQIGIVDGKATWLSTSALQGEYALYNVSPTASDYQIVTVVITSLQPGIYYLIGRSNSDFSDGVFLELTAPVPLPTPTISGSVNYYAGGYSIGSPFTVPLIPGASYSFVCGMDVSGTLQPGYFQVLLNGVAQPIGSGGALFVSDPDVGTTGSKIGASYRNAGFAFFGEYTSVPPPLSYWAMQDQQFTSTTGASGSIIGEVPSGTKNGTNVTFAVSHAFQAGTTAVYRNGLREVLGVGYTESSPDITFSTAPLSSDGLTVDYVLQ